MFHTQRPSNFFKFSSSFLYKPIFNKKPSVLITILISRKNHSNVNCLFYSVKTSFILWLNFLFEKYIWIVTFMFSRELISFKMWIICSIWLFTICSQGSLKLVMTILCKVCHRFIASFRLQEILEVVESNH